MEIDLHIHSCHSVDSFSRPEDIIKRAISLRLGAVAVTDHDSWDGWRAAAGTAGSDIIVVPGAELRTDKGDLLALFVHEVKAREWAAAIDEIRSQGGISVVPHPADSKRVTMDDMRAADALEAFNAKSTRAGNRRAAMLASELKKPALGSSDAHMVSAVGNGRTVVPDCGSLDDLRENMLKDPRPVARTETNPLLSLGYAAVAFGLKGVWEKARSV